MWDTRKAVTIYCKGETYTEKLSGSDLVNRLQDIAEDNDLGTFSVVDESGKSIEEQDIRNGNFKTPLTIVTYNKAA